MLLCTEMSRDELVAIAVPEDGGPFGYRAMVGSRGANDFASDVRDMASGMLLDRKEEILPALVALLVEYGYVSGVTKETLAGSSLASWDEYGRSTLETIPAPSLENTE